MTTLNIIILISFVFSVLLSTILVKVILNIAFKNSLFDNHEDRKIHDGNVPRLAGIGITLTTIVTMLLSSSIALTFLPDEATMSYQRHLIGMLLVLCAMLVLFAFGIVDDLRGLRYRTKFLGQIVSGCLLCLCDIRITNLYGLLGISDLPLWTSWLVTIFAVLLITNALNFIDGIDGLAGSLSLLCLIDYCGLSIYIQNEVCLWISLILIGAILPYLFFNLLGKAEKHNKIFMGDTGSLTIGFIICALGIYLYEQFGLLDTAVEPLVAAFAPLIVPCFDVVRVVFVRAYERRNAFHPDNSHIHHQILSITGSQSKTLCYLLLISVSFTIISYFLAFKFNINLVFVCVTILWITLMLIISRTKLKNKE